MEQLPKHVVTLLIAAGRREEIDITNIPEELNSIRHLDHINRLHWSTWDEVTQALDVDDLVALVKALAVAEEAFKWCGGSVAAVIWTFRELERRRYPDLKTLGECSQRDSNQYAPFGSMRTSFYMETTSEVYGEIVRRSEGTIRLAEERSVCAEEKRRQRSEDAATKRKLTMLRSYGGNLRIPLGGCL